MVKAFQIGTKMHLSVGKKVKHNAAQLSSTHGGIDRPISCVPAYYVGGFERYINYLRLIGPDTNPCLLLKWSTYLFSTAVMKVIWQTQIQMIC